eukprot:1137053-Pelagomonas_calceolata.AAC.2
MLAHTPAMCTWCVCTRGSDVKASGGGDEKKVTSHQRCSLHQLGKGDIIDVMMPTACQPTWRQHCILAQTRTLKDFLLEVQGVFREALQGSRKEAETAPTVSS